MTNIFSSTVLYPKKEEKSPILFHFDTPVIMKVILNVKHTFMDKVNTKEMERKYFLSLIGFVFHICIFSSAPLVE